MDANFFSSNRQNLMNRLQGGIAILSGNTAMQKTNDLAYAFAQEGNFYYLTGIREPDWKLIIDSSSGRTTLVAPIVESIHALFDGSLSFEEARRISGAERVIDENEAERYLRGLAKRHSIAYTLMTPKHVTHYNFSLNPAQQDNVRTLERIFGEIRDCQKELTALRAIKQPEEIIAVQKAVDITVDAFEKVKTNLNIYTHEFQIEADMTREFRYHGADGHAYDPIIASGNHACTLHYIDNSDRLSNNKLILLDVGASFQGYSADITRTYAKKQATKRQVQLHERLQHAQADIIGLLGPGVSVAEYSKSVDVIMKQALSDVRLLRDIDDIDTYRQYFPHAISHGLGIDTHDSLGGPTHFEPGMILTVEPGIYVPAEGIGIRIEDDILITKSGYKNLSCKLSTGL